MSTNEWDARRYNTNARFVSDLGAPLLALLAPQPGERILDLGCGDGALTAKLVESGASVLGVDSSSSMVQAARAFGLDAIEADMHSLSLDQSFDVVFTNAVLHWTRDIDAVLTGVRQHLRPGGRFVGEFGGFGNVAAISTAMRGAIATHGFPSSPFAWYFPTPEEFAQRLERASFRVDSIALIPRPTPLPAGMQGWLETFALPFLSHLPAESRPSVLETALTLLRSCLQDQSGNWTADYVRLRFVATSLLP
jgi:trans-aconitate methyltransferase